MGERPEMLFDMGVDPGEMNNLAAVPEHKEVLSKHRHLLKKWMQDNDDDYLTRFGVPAT